MSESKQVHRGASLPKTEPGSERQKRSGSGLKELQPPIFFLSLIFIHKYFPKKKQYVKYSSFTEIWLLSPALCLSFPTSLCVFLCTDVCVSVCLFVGLSICHCFIDSLSLFYLYIKQKFSLHFLINTFVSVYTVHSCFTLSDRFSPYICIIKMNVQANCKFYYFFQAHLND